MKKIKTLFSKKKSIGIKSLIMFFHLATSTQFDFDMFVRRAQEDKGPRHTIYQIGQCLDAKIHQPDQGSATFLDLVLSKIYSQPTLWALARRLTAQLTKNDVIYCAGEDVGLPLAILCKLKSDRPQIALCIMAPERLRTRILLKVLNIEKDIQLFTVNDEYKRRYLKHLMQLPDSKLFVLPEQTDAAFFTPGPGHLFRNVPLIASAGLEQRDYRTLARATQDKAVEVKICAFSPNASSTTQTSMPDPIPANMEIRYYDFSELRDLYRSASVVVISLLENRYSAGLTVLMEAMACNRPIIITRNIGLSSEIIDKELALGVEPGNEQELWKAIDFLLTNPEIAKDMTQRAYDYFLLHHTSDVYVRDLSLRLKVLGSHSPDLPPMK